jgi:hypothetical protein
MFEARNHQVDDLPFEAGDVLGMFCCLLSMFIHGLSPVWLVNLHVWRMSSQFSYLWSANFAHDARLGSKETRSVAKRMICSIPYAPCIANVSHMSLHLVNQFGCLMV